MDFERSARAEELHAELGSFVEEAVIPAEAAYVMEMAASGDPHHVSEVLEELSRKARSRGLWNLFLPHRTQWTEGLSNTDYAPLAELTGRSPLLAPEALNCSAPDTGNMELLEQFGTPEQQEQWLGPLLEGEIRSCFMMTEPDVASSDATTISCRIRRDGDDYVVSGRKWWVSGASDPRCRVAVVLGRSNPAAPAHQQHSMILVPMDTPGVVIERDLLVFGYNDREGHAEVSLQDVRVPAANLIGAEGAGFAIAQARLGPGRLHHCMRSIGTAERALELLCSRADDRSPFGRALADQGVVREWIADSRIEIDQARLLTLNAAWLLDHGGPKAAKGLLAEVKVAVPAMSLRVIDRAIQVHGGAGVSQDVPLGAMYANQRALRIADGPDEVHRRAIARTEIAAQRARTVARVPVPGAIGHTGGAGGPAGAHLSVVPGVKDA
ncbi:acyl-CoA dehydrogenase family protein [Patulibacter sp. NPDC049589]|uniref:acyl-CoA dehydrogenase family protein n=1 Tax=Patulibacter sp. NPDC049589 TaxID=3154731 RepID=UPI00341FE0E7